MKSVIVSGILILVMAAYLIIPAVPVIDYLINKDYIAKNLCINKDKPKSCCKGKCHMVKQLLKTNQNTEKDSKNTSSRVQLKDMNEFVISKSVSFSPQVVFNKYLTSNILPSDQLACSAIFVPPKLSSNFI